MKQFILGMSIGLSLWGFVACGVPDHWHPTTDIKQVDNNNTGVCQCKEPTNTIVVKEIEVDCSNPVDVPNNSKGVFIGGIEPNNILGSFIIQKVKNTNIDVRAALGLYSDSKSLYVHCERSFTLRLLLRK